MNHTRSNILRVLQAKRDKLQDLLYTYKTTGREADAREVYLTLEEVKRTISLMTDKSVFNYYARRLLGEGNEEK